MVSHIEVPVFPIKQCRLKCRGDCKGDKVLDHASYCVVIGLTQDLDLKDLLQEGATFATELQVGLKTVALSNTASCTVKEVSYKQKMYAYGTLSKYAVMKVTDGRRLPNLHEACYTIVHRFSYVIDIVEHKGAAIDSQTALNT